MVAITGGYLCIDRPLAVGYHLISSIVASGTPITDNGTITNVCIYNNFGDSFSIKCKILRINGTNYDLIHTHSSWQTHTGNGANNYTVDWAVEAGDLIAFTWASGVDNAGVDRSSSGGTYEYIQSDITGSIAISSFSSHPYPISLYATGVTDAIPLKINIGDSWKESSAIKINIGDSWKEVVGIQQNIGDSWKTVF